MSSSNVNIYAPNTEAPQYIRHTVTDIKEEIDSNTIIAGDFNTPLTPMDRSSKQKINKETRLKWYIRWDGAHWYLLDIPSKWEEYTLTSAYSPGYTISWVTSQISVNLRKLKLYQASSPTTMLWD